MEEADAETDPHEKLRKRIKENRDSLYNADRGVGGKSVFVDYIIGPISDHGSHAIYAPDEVGFDLATGLWQKMQSFTVGGAKTHLENLWKSFKKHMAENVIFICIVLASLAVFKFFGAELKCIMQNVLYGWAYTNQSLSWYWRALSISIMMALRLVVSNVLPFTSPAFAYLIALSQPKGHGYMGVVYLLVCSMPAGAIIPLLDKIFSAGAEDIEDHFKATRFASLVTDHLPFSFWVRPLFMEPAFAAAQGLGASSAGAASAAVLAGHFMIWSGPATTMYQRLFVPDYLTCILIQPLGLMEDIAVILATWAGESATSQKWAEISLYIFMIAMNFVSWKSKHPGVKSEHITMMCLTLIAILGRAMTNGVVYTVAPPSATTTTTTTVQMLCESEHSNVKVMILTGGWVTFLAIVFRIVARIVARIVSHVLAQKAEAGPRPHSPYKQNLLA